MAEVKEVHRDLIKRFRVQQSERMTIQTMWDAIERFITPYKGRMFEDQRSEHSMDWFKSRRVFDSTAVMAHQNLSASIHGSLTSPTMRWFDIRFRNPVLNKNKGAVKWLQSAAENIHYELQDSNFDLEVNKVYQDLVGQGTAFITLEEAPGPSGEWSGLNFTSIPLKEAFFEEDWNGGVLRFYRKLEMTPGQILHKFGDEVPERIKRMEADGNTDKIDILFVIYPRNNRVMKWGEKVRASYRPWANVYVTLDDSELLGREGGYYDMPVFAPRWETSVGSKWGNSPSMRALADVLQLNQVCKDVARARAKTIDPPMMAEERSIITDLNLDPATLTVVRSINGIGPLITGASHMDANAEIDRLQSAIRNYFMVDRIDFPDLQAQPMTATEAQIRYERMQRYMGATLAHLRNDMLNPTVQRAFNMLVREGRIDEPPTSVVEEGGQLDIEYLGSLTRAQQIDEVGAIERTMMTAANLAQVMPDALDAIDAVEGVRMIGRKLNAPADLMLSQDEVEAKQKQRREDEAAMMEAQKTMAQGEAMQAVGAGEQAMGGAE